MRKIIWIIVIVVVVGYSFNSCIENKSRQEAERIEKERIVQATKLAVRHMAERSNAVLDWEEKLSKAETVRFEPILTVELEQLWLQSRPILFEGSIKDIGTHNESQYLVSIERNLYPNFDYLFRTKLQLSLLSEKEKIDSFLKEHPNLFKDFGLSNRVAVVAHINSIRTINVPEEEGVRKEMKVGDGELIDILYTADVSF